MMRNLVTSLMLYEKIITTAAKAKELRSVADKMITLGKRGDLAARRQAAETLMEDKALKKLFDTIGARYQERNGGYTRITKLDYRMGDGAPLAAVELVGTEPAPEAKGEKAASPRRRRRRRSKRGEAAAGQPAAAAPES
jgi:large subunit ribosomal protein L17